MQIDFNVKEESKNFSFEELKTAYRKLFGSPEGKMVLDDLANRSHFFKGVPATSSGNELMQIEGMRIIYLHITYYLTCADKGELKITKVKD